MNNPLILPISEVKSENSQVITLFFEYPLKSKPGQFVMIWLPGEDQKPFSVSYDDGKRFGVSIFPVGTLSRALCALKVGDRAGVTGPYGRAFTISKNYHYILVGGGYGAGPLASLAEQVSALGASVDICLGAKTIDLLLFTKRLEQKQNINLRISTDDGSSGYKGFVTDLLRQIIHENKKNLLVATCGPEMMEKAVLNICNELNIACEISVERYMKCGFGVCGQCCMDGSGQTTCVDGPIMTNDEINKLTEFGKYHRDKSGTKIAY